MEATVDHAVLGAEAQIKNGPGEPGPCLSFAGERRTFALASFDLGF